VSPVSSHDDPHDAHDHDAWPPEGLRRRPALRTVLLLVIGAVFGAVATLTWTVAPSGRTVTAVVAAVDQTGSAIAVSAPEDLVDTGLGLVGVLWRDGEGAWQRTISADGYPTCVQPGDVDTTVRLGLVTEPGGPDRPPVEVVAWLECLAS